MRLTKKYTSVLIAALSLAPLAANAQYLTKTSGIAHAFGDLIKYAITLAGALALLAFLWGLAKFIFNSGDEKEVAKGKSIMKWGLIALFVMTSLGGIIAFLQGEFLGNSTSPNEPFNIGTGARAPATTGTGTGGLTVPCGAIPTSEGGIPCR